MFSIQKEGKNSSMIDILEDVIHDILPMLPFLLLTYIIVEYMEHHEHSAISRRFLSLKRWGPLFGAVLGVLPQCGISVIAVGLYVDGVVSLGTLIAVFISTSDEAIPILIAHPEHLELLGYIVAGKILLGISVGYFVDQFIKHRHISHTLPTFQAHCDCHEEHGSMLKNALMRTSKITAFVFLVNLLLSCIITWIGEDTLSYILLERSYWQPFFAAILGFIPNCAASVLLAQLYINGILSFGSLFAGLVSSAGLGLMVLMKVDHHRKDIIRIICILFLSGFISGTLLQLF